MPHGVLGLGIASIFSVTIGAANTLIIVLSATFYRDILRRYNDDQKSALQYSRIITLIITVIGIALSLLLPNIVQLLINAFFGISIIFPPLFSGFISKKKLNKYSGILSLSIGFILVVIFIPILHNQAFVPGMVGSILGLILGNLINKIAKRNAVAN